MPVWATSSNVPAATEADNSEAKVTTTDQCMRAWVSAVTMSKLTSSFSTRLSMDTMEALSGIDSMAANSFACTLGHVGRIGGEGLSGKDRGPLEKV